MDSFSVVALLNQMNWLSNLLVIAQQVNLTSQQQFQTYEE